MAESPDPYVRAKFQIEAVIGGHTFKDVVAISSTFSLNQVPTAHVTVAVGYEADKYGTGSGEATIHKARRSLKPRDKAKVTLRILTADGDTSKTETGSFTIFEGFLVGIGYQRSHNHMNYILTLVHWLDDLSNSSALNGNWFPNAPFDLATNAAFRALQLDEGNTWSSVPIIDSKGEFINKANAESDLWDSVIKPVFKKIATYNLPDGGKNDAALRALKRMLPEGGGGPYTPLRLDLSGLDSYNIDMALRHALTKDALDSFAHTTFWNKLIQEYAAQFFFAVSPAIEHATVIPFFGGLRWAEEAKTIKSDEYSYANFNANMAQLIEQVQIFWPAASDPMIGTGGTVQSTGVFSVPLAAFPEEKDADKDGLKLFKEPPPWVTNTSAWPSFTGATTAIKGKHPGDCLAPQTGESNPPPNWFRPTEMADSLLSSEVMKRFAQHWYKTELLGNRFGEISGKLRFDIAPGSTIRIEIPPRDQKLSDMPEYMMAAVTQVSYVINAERAVAGTSLSLSYLRTEDEDRDDKITETYAPVYKSGTRWYGGPMKKG